MKNATAIFFKTTDETLETVIDKKIFLTKDKPIQDEDVKVAFILSQSDVLGVRLMAIAEYAGYRPASLVDKSKFNYINRTWNFAYDLVNLHELNNNTGYSLSECFTDEKFIVNESSNIPFKRINKTQTIGYAEEKDFLDNFLVKLKDELRFINSNLVGYLPLTSDEKKILKQLQLAEKSRDANFRNRNLTVGSQILLQPGNKNSKKGKIVAIRPKFDEKYIIDEYISIKLESGETKNYSANAIFN